MEAGAMADCNLHLDRSIGLGKEEDGKGGWISEREIAGARRFLL
jgi:hypothetical protein